MRSLLQVWHLPSASAHRRNRCPSFGRGPCGEPGRRRDPTMTDEPNSDRDHHATLPASGPPDDGPTAVKPPARTAVRSGLARRRNPVLVTLGGATQTVRRIIRRDPVSLFLLLASIGLAIAFASLLGSIQPSTAGVQVPISSVHQLAKHHEISSALLLDHDNRVELTTKPAKGGRARLDVGGVSRLGRPDRAAAARTGSSGGEREGGPAVEQGHEGDHRPVPDPDPPARLPVLAVHPARREGAGGVSRPSRSSRARAGGAGREPSTG